MTTLKRYSGIGPRKTPPLVLGMMTEIASQLASSHWMLRSGHGDGADQAFGAGAIPPLKEIYLPEHGFNGAPSGMEGYGHYKVIDDNHPAAERIHSIAAMHHTKYWNMRSKYQDLMNRNVNIILGEHADLPSDMVVYWQSEDGAADYFGGTNHSIRIAKTFAIPTFNIRLDDELAALVEFVNQKDA